MKSEKYFGQPSHRQTDDRGLRRLTTQSLEQLKSVEENVPPDEELEQGSIRYPYLKPARPAEILSADLKTPLVEVKHTGNEQVGRGLYARKRIQAGDPVFEFDGQRRGEKKGMPMAMDGYSAHAIVVGNVRGANYYFVYATPNKLSPLRYLNHSCNPNVARTADDLFGFVALRTIEPGEEITADYSLLEANPYWSLDGCGCGEKNCRKKIGDVASLPVEYLKESWHRLSPQMQEFALRYSRDPEIVEMRNALGADAILRGESPLQVQKMSRDNIIYDTRPTIVVERNILGARALVKTFGQQYNANHPKETLRAA